MQSITEPGAQVGRKGGVTVPIPDATREDVLAAMALFDAEQRDTAGWRGWEANGNFRIAVEHEGRRYPVKQIVSLATGAQTSAFSGGGEANGWIRRRGFAVEQVPAAGGPSWWWVNQGATYKQERDGGYLWAPKQGKGGYAFAHWSSMAELAAGDIVIHYANSAIRAASRVADSSVDALRPEEPADGTGGEPGYLVRTDYHELAAPVPIGTVPEEWRIPEAGPFTQMGGVKQGYLFALSDAFACRLVTGLDRPWPEFLAEALPLACKDAPHRRIVKIGPGENARFWGDCLAGGYVCVGWDAVGDLRVYPGYEAFAAAFRQAYGEEYNGFAPKITEKARELWTIRELRPGDVVVANRGISEVLGVGEVGEPAYEWHPDRPEYRHTVRVCWDTSVAKAIPKQPTWAMKTIMEVPEELYRLIIGTGPGLDPVGAYVEPPFAEILAAIREQGMRVGERDVRRYHLALKTRGFVVLSGLSGTGKTWLAEAYAAAVGARHLVVPVAPNWTSNEDLLGYHNPLTAAYHDTPFSRFLRVASDAYLGAAAAGVAPRPHHLVLDEMNLARVEHYFARFLSAMEVQARKGTAPIELGPGEEVLLPPNLAIVGTVNVDETTHGFADKVYDRAQLVELEARRVDLVAHLGDAPYGGDLMAAWDAVHAVGPFTFRVLDEVAAYAAAAGDLGVPWQEALDEQLLQKVLPKLKGADPRVGEALERFCAVADGRFPLSGARATEMLDGYRRHGFASFFR